MDISSRQKPQLSGRFLTTWASVTLDEVDRVLDPTFRHIVKSLPSQRSLQKYCERLCLENRLTGVEIRDPTGNLVASALLLQKQLLKGDDTLHTALLSHVIVEPAFRGQGVFYTLMSGARRAMKELKVHLSFVVARREVDGLYSRVEYVGFQSFGEISLKLNSPKVLLADSLVSQVSDADEASRFSANFPCNEWYFHRSRADWENFFARGGVCLTVARKSGEALGYALLFNGLLTEIRACDVQSRARVFLCAKERGYEQAAASAIREVDQTLIANLSHMLFRYPLNGGHLFRIEELGKDDSSQRGALVAYWEKHRVAQKLTDTSFHFLNDPVFHLVSLDEF